ncbi:MAG: hypothetical protein IM572_10830 [Chitinophagaceae bacterium]|jgi:hypothetical protein|nr:hypothetical protein [Chitinophagaceae bacterium]
MKAFMIGLLLLWVNPWTVSAKYSGFESNINRMITSYRILIEDFDRGFSRLNYYFDSLDDYTSNKQFFTVSFTDNLNYSIENLEDSKSAIYDSLKTLINEIHYINNSRSTYHTKLEEGFDEVIQFIATMDTEDVDATLKTLFSEFIVKKNLFFYGVSKLKDYFESTLVNTVNTYDMIETFMHDSMLNERNKFTKLTVKQVQKFYYITGLLSQLKEYYEIHNQLLEEINRTLLSLEDTLGDVDGYLESLKFYYYRRYVEGYTEDEINNFPQTLFTEKVEQDVENDSDDKFTENKRDPIDVCDQVLMSNYGIQGLQIATEVDEFEKIPLCPSIANSCCASKELETLYKSYYDEQFDLLNRKQNLVKGILTKILSSYHHLRDLGYYFLKNPISSSACRETGRKIVFTPIGKDFVDRFNVYMTNAHEFAARARASSICMICDYDVQKSMLEGQRIKLSKEFCSTMMTNFFDYVNIYNYQLVDYFNNIVELVQCDKDTGILNKNEIIEFQSNDKVNNIIADCQTSREYCERFCQQFKFLDIESALDIDIQTLRKFYNFLDGALKEKEVILEGVIDSSLFSSSTLRYVMEKNDLPMKSLDKMAREFVKDVNDETAQNPFLVGTSLLKVLTSESLEE